MALWHTRSPTYCDATRQIQGPVSDKKKGDAQAKQRDERRALAQGDEVCDDDAGHGEDAAAACALHGCVPFRQPLCTKGREVETHLVPR